MYTIGPGEWELGVTADRWAETNNARDTRFIISCLEEEHKLSRSNLRCCLEGLQRLLARVCCGLVEKRKSRRSGATTPGSRVPNAWLGPGRLTSYRLLTLPAGLGAPGCPDSTTSVALTHLL